MSLADALEATHRRPGPCRVAKVLESLDGDDRETLAQALDPDSGWRHTQIAEALRSFGVSLHNTQIGVHRRGTCSCP